MPRKIPGWVCRRPRGLRVPPVPGTSRGWLLEKRCPGWEAGISLSGKQGFGSGEHGMVTLPLGTPGRALRGSTGAEGHTGSPGELGQAPHVSPGSLSRLPLPCPQGTCCASLPVQGTARALLLARGCRVSLAKRCQVPAGRGVWGICGSLRVCHGVGRKGVPMGRGPAVLGIAYK